MNFYWCISCRKHLSQKSQNSVSKIFRHLAKERLNPNLNLKLEDFKKTHSKMLHIAKNKDSLKIRHFLRRGSLKQGKTDQYERWGSQELTKTTVK